MTTGETIALVIIIIIGVIGGRLGVRAFLNKALGGTLFGGNIL